MIGTALASFLVALGSALIPFVPCEPYLLGVVATTGGNPVVLGVAVAAGQTVGKVAMVLALRGTLRTPALHRLAERHRRPAARSTATGTATYARLQRVSRVLAAALDRPRVAVPVVLLSATIGLPPLLLVVFAIGATRMPVGLFAAACMAGRTVRFVAVALLPQLIAVT